MRLLEFLVAERNTPAKHSPEENETCVNAEAGKAEQSALPQLTELDVIDAA